MHQFKPKASGTGDSVKISEITEKLLQMGVEESQVRSSVKQCSSIHDAILHLTSVSECQLCTEERNESEVGTAENLTLNL